VFITTPQTMVSRIPAGWPLPERWATWQAEMNHAQKERRPFYLAVALLLVAGTAVAAAARTADEGAAVAVAVVFAGLVLSCYYWVVLVLLALRRGNGGTVGVLAVNAATLLTALLTSDAQIIFGVFSWGLLAMSAALFFPDVSRSIRQRSSALNSASEATISSGHRVRRSTKSKGKRERRGKRAGFVETVGAETSTLLGGIPNLG
jgi:hypothetical protein